jgi:hypothetical protein
MSTGNRWVTDGHRFDATTTPAALDGFVMDTLQARCRRGGGGAGGEQRGKRQPAPSRRPDRIESIDGHGLVPAGASPILQSRSGPKPRRPPTDEPRACRRLPVGLVQPRRA